MLKNGIITCSEVLKNILWEIFWIFDTRAQLKVIEHYSEICRTPMSFVIVYFCTSFKALETAPLTIKKGPWVLCYLFLITL